MALVAVACGDGGDGPDAGLDAAPDDGGADAALPDSGGDSARPDGGGPDAEPGDGGADSGTAGLEDLTYLRIELADMPVRAFQRPRVIGVAPMREVELSGHPALALSIATPSTLRLDPSGAIVAIAPGRGYLSATLPRSGLSDVTGNVEITIDDEPFGGLLLRSRPVAGSGSTPVTMLTSWRTELEVVAVWSADFPRITVDDYTQPIPAGDLLAFRVGDVAIADLERAGDVLSARALARGTTEVEVEWEDPLDAAFHRAAQPLVVLGPADLRSPERTEIGSRGECEVGRSEDVGVLLWAQAITGSSPRAEVAPFMAWSSSDEAVVPAAPDCDFAQCEFECRTIGTAILRGRLAWEPERTVELPITVWSRDELDRIEVSPASLVLDPAAGCPAPRITVTAYPVAGPAVSFDVPGDDPRADHVYVTWSGAPLPCCIGGGSQMNVAYHGHSAMVPAACPP